MTSYLDCRITKFEVKYELLKGVELPIGNCVLVKVSSELNGDGIGMLCTGVIWIQSGYGAVHLDAVMEGISKAAIVV